MSPEAERSTRKQRDDIRDYWRGGADYTDTNEKGKKNQRKVLEELGRRDLGLDFLHYATELAAEVLEEKSIAYAIVGCYNLFMRGRIRYTDNVDIGVNAAPEAVYKAFHGNKSFMTPSLEAIKSSHSALLFVLVPMFRDKPLSRVAHFYYKPIKVNIQIGKARKITPESLQSAETLDRDPRGLRYMKLRDLAGLKLGCWNENAKNDGRYEDIRFIVENFLEAAMQKPVAAHALVARNALAALVAAVKKDAGAKEAIAEHDAAAQKAVAALVTVAQEDIAPVNAEQKIHFAKIYSSGRLDENKRFVRDAFKLKESEIEQHASQDCHVCQQYTEGCNVKPAFRSRRWEMPVANTCGVQGIPLKNGYGFELTGMAPSSARKKLPKEGQPQFAEEFQRPNKTTTEKAPAEKATSECANPQSERKRRGD